MACVVIYSCRLTFKCNIDSVYVCASAIGSEVSSCFTHKHTTVNHMHVAHAQAISTPIYRSRCSSSSSYGSTGHTRQNVPEIDERTHITSHNIYNYKNTDVYLDILCWSQLRAASFCVALTFVRPPQFKVFFLMSRRLFETEIRHLIVSTVAIRFLFEIGYKNAFDYI
jgi:hypothetical protein